MRSGGGYERKKAKRGTVGTVLSKPKIKKMVGSTLRETSFWTKEE